jgi:hypothetical protein
MHSRVKQLVLAIGALALVVGIIYGADASGDMPPSGLGGSPTPVWDETAIPEVTAEPTIFISELPSTGAGTTAREVVQGNHDYTTTTLGCTWQWFGYPTLFTRTNYYTHNWWGSGHYRYAYTDYHEWWIRCYAS